MELLRRLWRALTRTMREGGAAKMTVEGMLATHLTWATQVWTPMLISDHHPHALSWRSTVSSTGSTSTRSLTPSSILDSNITSPFNFHAHLSQRPVHLSSS